MSRKTPNFAGKGFSVDIRSPNMLSLEQGLQVAHIAKFTQMEEPVVEVIHPYDYHAAYCQKLAEFSAD